MYRDFEHRLAEAEGAPCAAGSADSASRMHATRVSNLACPSICAIEAIDFLLLQVRPRAGDPRSIRSRDRRINIWRRRCGGDRTGDLRLDSARPASDLAHDIFPALVRDRGLRAHRSAEYFKDFGTPDRLAAGYGAVVSVF